MQVRRRAVFEGYNFALVICRHPGTQKWLAVEEIENRGWWIPGGGVDAGESFRQAAVRECREEAGLDVTLKGILAINYDVCAVEPRRKRSHDSAKKSDFPLSPPSSTGARQNLGRDSPIVDNSWISRTRMRAIFYAEPVDADQAPKRRPDEESIGAEWVTLAEFKEKQKIRGTELLNYGTYVENGGAIFPLQMFRELA